MKILIATDAWLPQINGVVTTLLKLKEFAEKDKDVELVFITPDDFLQIPNPIYPEVKLSFVYYSKIDKLIREKYQPDYIHIATEGPIGWEVRKWCKKNKKAFTTSYHTKFPEFLNKLIGVPESISYQVMKTFHNAGSGIMVTTESLKKDLLKRGFNNVNEWSRGVDLSLFKPIKTKTKLKNKTVLLYVGRVSKEKSIESFLDINYPDCIKVVVGDGPELSKLKKKYKDVWFTGPLKGKELADWYKNADVFVFPSKADTFGIVIIEALACGTPVAAYPVTGPIDILNNQVGAMHEDLKIAIDQALKKDRKKCAEYAKRFSWEYSYNVFINNILISNSKIEEYKKRRKLIKKLLTKLKK